jgi:hypothetical protein
MNSDKNQLMSVFFIEIMERISSKIKLKKYMILNQTNSN